MGKAISIDKQKMHRAGRLRHSAGGFEGHRKFLGFVGLGEEVPPCPQLESALTNEGLRRQEQTNAPRPRQRAAARLRRFGESCPARAKGNRAQPRWRRAALPARE